MDGYTRWISDKTGDQEEDLNGGAPGNEEEQPDEDQDVVHEDKDAGHEDQDVVHEDQDARLEDSSWV